MIQLKSGKTWSQLYSFELISFDRQMATFADNSVAIFFFHSPWRPKWSQLGALLQGRKKTRLENSSWKLYHLSWCAWWWACYSAGSHDLLAVKQVNVNFVTQYSPGVLFTWCSPWNRTEVWPKGLRFSPVVLRNQKIIKFKFNLGGPPHTCPERKPSPLQGFFSA